MYLKVGRTADAIPRLRSALERREALLGSGHPEIRRDRHNLATAYEALGRWAEAEPLRRQVLTDLRKRVTPDSHALGGQLALLAGDLLRQSRWTEAEPLLRECLAIRLRTCPDEWLRFNTMSELGGALLGRARYAEAEPLIIRGYNGLIARTGAIPPPDKPRLPEAAERVVRLYESWGRPDEASRWKARLGLAGLPADVFARP